MLMMLIARWRRVSVLHGGGWFVLVLAAAAWLSIDTLAYRLSGEAVDAAILLNAQGIVGVLLIGLLSLAAWLNARCTWNQ